MAFHPAVLPTSLPFQTFLPSCFSIAPMTNRILYLAAYDISDPGRLRDALYALKAHASGGQKSVFECFLTDGERRDLLAEVRLIIDLSEDRFMLMPLTGQDGIQTLGVAVKPEDPDFYYVG